MISARKQPYKPNIVSALNSLELGNWQLTGADPTTEAEFHAQFKKEMSVDDGVVTWSTDPADFGATWSQVLAAKASLQATFEAEEYAHSRLMEYPEWYKQFEKIYDDGIDKWKTEMIDPIKAKYPKP